MLGLFFNALSTVFGTGMSLFAKVSGGGGTAGSQAALLQSRHLPSEPPLPPPPLSLPLPLPLCRQPGHRRV